MKCSRSFTIHNWQVYNILTGSRDFQVFTFLDFGITVKIDFDFATVSFIVKDKKDAVLLGEYGCRGFNTYGLWKLIGGMNRMHPTVEEQEAAVRFVESLLDLL